MNHNTPFRLRRTIVLALAVATAMATATASVAAIDPRFVNPTAGAMVATAEPVAAPLPGATVEPVAAPLPGATVEPVAATRLPWSHG